MARLSGHQTGLTERMAVLVATQESNDGLTSITLNLNCLIVSSVSDKN
jgi:hypothetical protein